MKRTATCHPLRDYYAKGLCKNCYKSWWKKGNPESANRYRGSQKNHAREIASHKSYYSTHKKEAKAYALKKLYGITLDDFEQLLIKQKGKCYFCNKQHSQTKPLLVDHNHETGKVRGLLCLSHNQAVAKFGDTLAGALKLVEYLNQGEGN